MSDTISLTRDEVAILLRAPNFEAYEKVSKRLVAFDRSPPAPAELSVGSVPCPCTLIEQDEDTPIGYPSLLCGICDGKGHTTQEQVTALACEMIKIASDVGEPEDPFAAWETIDLFKSQNDQMRRVIDAVWRCGLVIESSVRRGDGPAQYAEVVEALKLVKQVRAALSSPMEGGE